MEPASTTGTSARVPALDEEPEIVKFVRTDGVQYEGSWDPDEYDPDSAQPAYEIYVKDGKLVLDQGQVTIDLLTSVRTAEFTRRRGAPRCIDVTIYSSDYSDGQNGITKKMSFMLMTP